MFWSIVWSSTATARLIEMEDWLYERSPEASRRFIDQIDQDVQRLAEHPESAPIWSRHPSLNVRRLVSGKVYLIFYELLETSNEVLILTIRHARQPSPKPSEVKP